MAKKVLGKMAVASQGKVRKSPVTFKTIKRAHGSLRDLRFHRDTQS